MVTKEQILRINALYKKQQEVGLTEEEKNEQSFLRKLYIDSMKESLRGQLKSIKVVSPEEYEKYKNEEQCKCGHNHEHDHDHEHEHDHEHHDGCNCGCREQKN